MSGDNILIYRNTNALYVLLGVSLLLLGFVSWDAILDMVHIWETREEYGHGFLIPVISILMILQNKDKLEQIEFKGSWLGVFIVLVSLFVLFIGTVSTIFAIVEYAMVFTLFGIAYTFTGAKGMKYIGIPILFLLFMIPLPVFIFRELSANLQLISSQLGVAVIRLFDISVYLEGNVIDLGVYKLQVVEACSGLRYLFPLMSLAFLCAYLFKAPLWKKAIIFLSSMPITVLMNSFRIGMIGVLVEYGGIEQAEGFLHDFEGWIIFMACLAILVLEMWLLNKMSRDSRPLQEVFGLEYPDSTPENAKLVKRQTQMPLIVVTVLMIVFAGIEASLDARKEIIPEREALVGIPMQLGEWHGRPNVIEQKYLDLLKLDDYVITDYIKGNQAVNFYVAYYASQRAGESAHSPRSCIPGGGWLISDLSQKTIKLKSAPEKTLTVNRLVIVKGEYKQVVYYWFQQRGRTITNEYLVKWYLLIDSIMENRSDGALVRLTTMSKPGEDLSEADKRIQSLINELYPTLNKYIPD